MFDKRFKSTQRSCGNFSFNGTINVQLSRLEQEKEKKTNLS